MADARAQPDGATAAGAHADGPRLGAPVRAVVGVAAVANLGASAAYVTQAGWAAWPWETGRLSHLFLASMLAAVGVAAAWIAFSGESGSLPGGFLNLAITQGGVAAYLLTGGPSAGGATAAELGNVTVLGLVVAVLAVLNLLLFWWTLGWRQPAGDPVPRLVRGSYVVFAVVLLVVGVLLIRRTDGIMPWPLDPDTSVLFGWIFFGDAWYFAYAVARPQWQCARAQLWSFLGYDAVLLVPLLLHLRNAPPDLRDNLLLYLAVLLYSTALAVYYLLLNPRTRGWGSAQRGSAASGAVSAS